MPADSKDLANCVKKRLISNDLKQNPAELNTYLQYFLPQPEQKHFSYVKEMAELGVKQ